MSAKLRTMFRKQTSLGQGDQATRAAGADIVRSRSAADETVVLRQKTSRRRHKTSLGAFEEIIKCPICSQTLQSPKMLICQHTFCKKCLETILVDTFKDKESSLTCPVCKVTTRNVEPDGLPANLSIESVLRAINGSFIEARPERGRSLVVNFGPLTAEQRRENGNTRCFSCATACEAVDFCQHCRQVFCKVCQAQHVELLKEQLKLMIEQLQHTIDKLNHQVVEFKDKSKSLKEAVEKEYEEKIVALQNERRRRLEEIDDFAVQGERTADEIKLRILESQAELLRQRNGDFDGIADDNQKISKFLELHKKSTDMISKAFMWHQRISDVIEVNGDSSKLRERDNNVSNRPRLICGRKYLQRPSGLTKDPTRGDIYVACPGSAQVVVLDQQYRIMRRIQNSHMMAPQSLVFVNKLHELYVTDKWKHTIFVYNRKGELLRKIGEKGAGEGQFRCPEGLDVLQSRNWLFVADTGNDRVQILGTDGSVKGCIGPAAGVRSERDATRIIGTHSFNQPTDVAVSNNAIVVADCGNHKIKVFNHKGQLMFAIGGFGPFRGLLKSPEVVKLDASGNIIVGDSDNHRVQVFSPQGEFVRTFGSEGTAVGQFGWVSGILCLPNHEILVADSKNNTLQLF